MSSGAVAAASATSAGAAPGAAASSAAAPVVIGYKDHRVLNGKSLESLIAGAADGWSATAESQSMQTGTTYLFAGGRLYNFCMGYIETASKTSEATFDAQQALMARIGAPLSRFVARTVDWGSDGMSKAARKLWRAA